MARHCSLTKVSVLLFLALCCYGYSLSTTNWVSFTGYRYISGVATGTNPFDNRNETVSYTIVQSIARCYGVHRWCEMDLFNITVNGTTIINNNNATLRPHADATCYNDMSAISNWADPFTNTSLFIPNAPSPNFWEANADKHKDQYKAFFICAVTAAAAAGVACILAFIRGVLCCCCLNGAAKVTQGLITFLTFSATCIGAISLYAAVESVQYLHHVLGPALHAGFVFDGLTFHHDITSPDTFIVPLHVSVGATFAVYCMGLLLTFLSMFESFSQCCCAAPEYQHVENVQFGVTDTPTISTAFLSKHSYNKNTYQGGVALHQPTYASNAPYTQY